MSRTKAREVALQALFMLDFNDAIDSVAAVTAVLEELEELEESEENKESRETDKRKLTEKDIDYAMSLARGAKEHRAEIDERIKGVSKNWQIRQMAAIDRNIVRLATYEIFFGKEKIKANIAINEAVELSKKYGTDDSNRFVNGILGVLVRSSTSQ